MVQPRLIAAHVSASLGASLAHPMGEGSGVRALESGGRTGVRAVVSVHLPSMSSTIDGAESGFLSLRRFVRLKCPARPPTEGGIIPSAREAVAPQISCRKNVVVGRPRSRPQPHLTSRDTPRH